MNENNELGADPLANEGIKGLPVVAFKISTRSMSDPVEVCLYSEHLAAIAQRDAELAELREQNERTALVYTKELDDLAGRNYRLSKENAALQSELAAMRLQKPVAHQFQGRDGEWYVFQSQKHYEDTAADGSWPIRALYAAPVSAPRTPAEWSAAGCKCVRYGVGNPHWPCPLHPIPAPVQVAAEVVQVPRELAERIAKPVLFASQQNAHADDCAELRALLATSQEVK